MHQPVIQQWGLYFRIVDGYENRDEVVKAFLDFLTNPSIGELKIPGRYKLGGQVYGSEKFAAGKKIMTSLVQSIEKIKNDDCPDDQCKLLCATTKTGSKYYFYQNKVSPYMDLMFKDMTSTGKLNNQIWYYLEKEDRKYLSSEFI